MKVTGSTTLHAPAGQVWAALNDPAVLVRTIPGCERLAADGPSSYQFTVTAGVASIRGTYTGQVSLHDQQPPGSFRLKASGAGGPGTVSTTVDVWLADDGNGFTQLSYDADAVVGGVIAGVGQRMLASVAKRMAGDFFTAVDDVLTAAVPAPAPAAAVGPAPAGAAGWPSVSAAFPGRPGTPAAPPAASPAASSAGMVWEAPRGQRPAAGGGASARSFLLGVAAGAAAALAGVVVGSVLSRRRG